MFSTLLQGIKNKYSFYWCIIIPTFIFVTLFISLSPWLAQLLATPRGNVFTGIHWWSPDYATYLSYVELGRRGQIGALLLRTTMVHQPVYAHLAHTLSGFLFGRVLQFNSVSAYHISRVLYGAIFLFATVLFFYRFSKSKVIALFAFLFSFYISGFARVEQFVPLKISHYLEFRYGSDIIQRSTGPLHYSVGYIFFIVTVCWFFGKKSSNRAKALVFGILLNLLLLANPFAYIIIAFSFGYYVLLRLLFTKNRVVFVTGELPSIVAGFAISLPLVYYFREFLSKAPWGLVGAALRFYQTYLPPVNIQNVLMAFFPLFFCGFLGIVGIVTKKIKTSTTSPQTAFLVSWILAHIFLLLFGDQIKIDPLRSNQGLHYLPLSLFSAYFVVALSEKLAVGKSVNYKVKGVAVVIFIFLLTLPNFILSYRNNLFAFTDFKNFSLQIYPTKKQVEAFQWLEKNTPIASGVIAMYEASELIPGFSGNSTDINMDEMAKIRFFSNSMLPDESYRFLKENNFHYVYLGYQELYYGGEITKLPFLTKVFENDEVKIYQVLKDF